MRKNCLPFCPLTKGGNFLLVSWSLSYLVSPTGKGHWLCSIGSTTLLCIPHLCICTMWLFVTCFVRSNGLLHTACSTKCVRKLCHLIGIHTLCLLPISGRRACLIPHFLFCIRWKRTR
uniref:Uncharacterized protein n=1 Tax=Opuntia streptacantha TaxID=393608 RepID=A0A7C8YSJ5_OPUST